MTPWEAAVVERVLSDEVWAEIAGILPGKEGDPGCHGRDNRLFLEAVFWIARTGSPWRDLPLEFGKWYTTYTRYHRWEKRGVWPRVFMALQKHGAVDLLRFADRLRVGEWAPPPASIEALRGERVAA
jgi:transposase